jgi:hypothetical protein
VLHRQLSVAVIPHKLVGQFVNGPRKIGDRHKRCDEPHVEPSDAFVVAGRIRVGYTAGDIVPLDPLAQPFQRNFGRMPQQMPQPHAEMGLVRPLRLGQAAIAEGRGQLFGSPLAHSTLPPQDVRAPWLHANGQRDSRRQMHANHGNA